MREEKKEQPKMTPEEAAKHNAGDNPESAKKAAKLADEAQKPKGKGE